VCTKFSQESEECWKSVNVCRSYDQKSKCIVFFRNALNTLMEDDNIVMLMMMMNLLDAPMIPVGCRSLIECPRAGRSLLYLIPACTGVRLTFAYLSFMTFGPTRKVSSARRSWQASVHRTQQQTPLPRRLRLRVARRSCNIVMHSQPEMSPRRNAGDTRARHFSFDDRNWLVEVYLLMCT